MDELFFYPLKLKDLIDFQQDSIVSKVLLKNNAGNVTIFAFWEGQEISEHHTPFTAILYCIEGLGLITDDFTDHQLSPGDIFVIPERHPHSVKALTNFKLLLVMIKDNL